MFTGKTKYEVSDPAFYDSIIAEQKKRVRQHFQDAEKWLELGRLRESKIEMTNNFARRQFFIRYFLPIFVLCLLGFIVSYHFIVSQFPNNLWVSGLISAVYLFATLVLIQLWFLRYPPSGSKYFKKAIQLEPQCGDAYMYLGLIALRRYQKRKACRYFERAMQLSVSNKNKIEQELKSIYEKEFNSFFNKRSEKDIRQQQIIDHQQDQIRLIRSKNANLEKMAASLNDKLDQARWEMGHKTKMMEKEKKSPISAIRKDYECQIAVLKEEAKEGANELAARDFVRLTTEIMESKASLEVQSLEAAAQTVEDMMGKDSLQAFSKQTRSYLATAEQVYTVLSEQEENPDYSLVGMELCKALETELNKRLVEPFIGYLNGKKSDFLRINQTSTTKDGPSYYTYLARVADQVNYPEVNSLTLGQCHFALKLALEGDYALSEYANFLDETCAASGAIIVRAFSEKLETVTHKYRNAIAHQSPMNKKEYEHLRDLIFAGEGALLIVVAAL